MDKTQHHPPIDNAFAGASLKGGGDDPTYAGALSFMRRVYSKDATRADAVVWGIPLDIAVTNRPGARFGPQAIRRASAIFDGDPQYPFESDIYQDLAVIDYGDCLLDLGHPDTIPGAIEEQAAAILATGAHLFSLGGDHFVTWPLLKAHAERHGKLALVQFDAHQDTWPDDGVKLSHGTFVLRAVREGIIDPDRSIQIGIRTNAPEDCGIEIVDAYTFQDLGPEEVARRIVERVGDHPAYMTFDIDCLDPAVAPGTGTPVSGGPSAAQALMTLLKLQEVNFVGGDVVEVSPPYDHSDITAIAAATVAQHYLGMLARRDQTPR